MTAESDRLEQTILALKKKLARDVTGVREEKKETKGDTGSENSNDLPVEDGDGRYCRTHLKPKRSRFKLVTEQFFEETTGDYRPRMVYEKGDLQDDGAIQRQIDAELGLTEDDLMSGEEMKEVYGDQSVEEIVDSLKLDTLFRPISKPSDVVTIPSIAHTYKSQHLDRLADELIHTIQHEQSSVVLLSNLMNIFLGDDSSRVLEADMGLPEYDHNLDLDKQQQQAKEEHNPLLENTQQQVHTSAAMAMNPNADPFFMPPVYQSDPELNLELQDADELRQLVQIALQRNEEFVRSLSQIRGGFVRATRLRDFVYQWCTEIHQQETAQTEKQA